MGKKFCDICKSVNKKKEAIFSIEVRNQKNIICNYHSSLIMRNIEALNFYGISFNVSPI